MVNINQKKHLKKILILGLDNSGKSSLVFSFQKKNNLSYYTSLEPTRGENISKIEDINREFIIWDIGGQVQHRQDFLNNSKKYILETSKVIFVIDVQDTERYHVALNYLHEILDKFKKEKIFVKISVFLHKFDSDLIVDEDGVNGLIKKIRAEIPVEFNYDIVKSSIETIYRKTTII